MLKTTRVLGLFFSILYLSSCSTDTHSNPVNDSDDKVIEVETTVMEEEVLADDELKSKILGSWSTNAQPGQIDFNEDGTYLDCEFFNSAAINAETESCIDGIWSINKDKLVIILPDGDTTSNSVTWVFDNVIYLGHENEEIGQEEAWEYGMTKL